MRDGIRSIAAADHDIILGPHQSRVFYDNDRYLWPIEAVAIGDGARAKCSKRPTALWAEDEAVPLGGVVAVVLAESSDHHARDYNVLYTAGDLVAAHQVSSGA